MVLRKNSAKEVSFEWHYPRISPKYTYSSSEGFEDLRKK